VRKLDSGSSEPSVVVAFRLSSSDCRVLDEWCSGVGVSRGEACRSFVLGLLDVRTDEPVDDSNVVNLSEWKR